MFLTLSKVRLVKPTLVKRKGMILNLVVSLTGKIPMFVPNFSQVFSLLIIMSIVGEDLCSLLMIFLAVLVLFPGWAVFK